LLAPLDPFFPFRHLFKRSRRRAGRYSSPLCYRPFLGDFSFPPFSSFFRRQDAAGRRGTFPQFFPPTRPLDLSVTGGHLPVGRPRREKPPPCPFPLRSSPIRSDRDTIFFPPRTTFCRPSPWSAASVAKKKMSPATRV